MREYVIGVDEAGRGPLAGPVAVGVVLVKTDFDWGLIEGVNDSKQLSARKREAIFKQAKELKQTGQLNFAVAMVSAAVIDRVGISEAIRRAMKRALEKVNAFSTVNSTKVLLDGSLKAPVEFISQETIIKGDSKERVIGLASIMAKVTRDNYMRRQAKLAAYAPYDLATHKGYGTAAHRAAIAKHGLSPLHRASYCKNIVLL